MKNYIIAYCDGACSGNPGPGGWGAVLEFRGKQLEICGGDSYTTNNKMELTAAIRVLQRIENKKLPVEIFLDSAYVLNGITKWVPAWKRNGWTTSNKKTPVKNKELWIELDKLVTIQLAVRFTKVKGHAGIELNELADQLANKGMEEYK